MKTTKILSIALGALMAVACSDFEDININPKAVNSTDAKPYWALNKAIISDQQNPNDAERVFVLYWADIARQDGESGGRAVGRSNDEWAGCLYNLTKNCVTSCNNAIKLVDENLPNLSGHEAEFYPNVKAAARIWRVYLMTEFVDSFGCFTTDFESTSPVYSSVQDCYKFMFDELAEAVPAINTSVTASTDLEKKGDPAYGYDPVKWKNFGISMWMRIAMRLSEVDPGTAKAQFEKAVSYGQGIIDGDGTFKIKEHNGWDDLSGVMSRTWDWQELSMTMANLTTNLGGADVLDILKDPGKRLYPSTPNVREVYGPYVKDADKYLGIKIEGYVANVNGIIPFIETNTDSPTVAYYFDGLPSRIDPRAFAYFTLPGDYDNRKETGYDPFMRTDNTLVPLATDKNADPVLVETKFAWNGLVCGHSWNDPMNDYYGLYNGSDANYGTTYPSLAERYRNTNGTESRVFFGPWETYFLLAEAAERGWSVGISARDAYYRGIKASLDYVDMGDTYEAYINSENYNRVGTSVSWDHTAEPVNYTTVYHDIHTDEDVEVTYEYPIASKTLYGKALNDHMCKIMTQKYIANTPWLPLENWSDHRRTGLPFWEIPAGSTEYPFLSGWTTSAYKDGQKVGFYAQRMNYPNSFKNANPEEYQHALQLMGMTDENTVTPLWWAKQK